MENKTFIEHWRDRVEIYRKRRERGEPQYPTGIAGLDAKIDGLHKGRLTIIAGRSGLGKTSLSLQIASHLADNPKNHILFLTLEMTGGELAGRIFCNTMGVDSKQFEKGLLPIEKFEEKQKDFEEIITGVDLEIIEKGFSFEEVIKIIKGIYPKKTKPDIIFVDFVQMIEVKGRESERIAFAEYTRKLKELAKTEDMAIVMLSQIRRLPSGADMNREPGITDLLGCVKGDTLIGDKKIKDIFEKQDFSEIKTIELKTGKTKYIKPEKIVDTGILSCYKIKTKSGKEIILSEDTKVYCESWKKAKELKIGNKLLTIS